MRQFSTNFSTKNTQSQAYQTVVVVDSGVGMVALLDKLQALPVHLMYLNIYGATTNSDANQFVSSHIQQLDDTRPFALVVPSKCPNLRAISASFDRCSVVKVTPPLYQAMQYSTTRVALLSSTNARCDDCKTIDATHLAKLITNLAPQRQIRQQIEHCLSMADGCDAVVFDDCIFSTQKHNFWMLAPNVKFFDCTDSVASIFYKNKKLRQNKQTPQLTTHFCDKTGKTEQIFDKIFQKIYKPY